MGIQSPHAITTLTTKHVESCINSELTQGGVTADTLQRGADTNHADCPRCSPFWIAGAWEEQTEEFPAGYFVLTTAPNEMVEQFHDRMPAILTDEMAQA